MGNRQERMEYGYHYQIRHTCNNTELEDAVLSSDFFTRFARNMVFSISFEKHLKLFYSQNFV
jgi:hypothetical protein